MAQFLITSELVVAVLLAISILLQSKAAGMGSMGGEESESFSTKRGAEKFLHNASVTLAVIFALIAALYPVLTKIA